MKNLFLCVAAVGAFLTAAAKAETIKCTEITGPTVITVQGVYCLKTDKKSAATNGNFIDIQTNNVTIDLNGHKLRNLRKAPAAGATGIRAISRRDITIRNGTIQGFLNGVSLIGDSSSGALVENLRLDGNRAVGVTVQGTGNVIRNNQVLNTGGGTSNEADGIVLSSARSTVIADNIITGTSETAFAIGILVISSSAIELRGNSILDTKDATTTRGIEAAASTNVTAIDNRVLNAATGDAGIIDSSSTTGLGCIDNTVAGFTAALVGCDLLAGNNTL